MNITSAKYGTDQNGNNIGVMAVIDGGTMWVPNDPDNDIGKLLLSGKRKTAIQYRTPANGDVITVRFFGRAVDQPTSFAMQLFKYTATASQTAFTGGDANGAILAFLERCRCISKMCVHLDSSDFTASNVDTITLGSGRVVNDELVIRAFRAFTVTDTVSKSSGGTFAAEITAPQFRTTNTTVYSAVFRTNGQSVSEDTTIASTKNALAIGPLTISLSTAITVNGNLTIL